MRKILAFEAVLVSSRSPLPPEQSESRSLGTSEDSYGRTPLVLAAQIPNFDR